MAFSQEVVDVGGCKISLKRDGKGQKLLFLHGAGGAAVVQPFMNELAKEYEVWIPEHPGFGKSDEPAWLDNIHDLAYFYLDFMEQFDLRNTRVIGVSIGGWLSLEIAVRSTARIHALSLVGPSGIYVDGHQRGDLFLWNPEERVRNLFVDQSIADRLLALPVGPDDVDTQVKNQYTVARLAWEPRLFDPHLYKWLHRIKVPTQIIWGDSDKIIPAAYAAEFKKLIPQARVDIIERCGHLPPTEKPADFLRVFREFAARI